MKNDTHLVFDCKSILELKKYLEDKEFVIDRMYMNRDRLFVVVYFDENDNSVEIISPSIVNDWYSNYSINIWTDEKEELLNWVIKNKESLSILEHTVGCWRYKNERVLRNTKKTKLLTNYRLVFPPV